MKCSYEGCSSLGTRPQYTVGGAQWANLCEAHHDYLGKITASRDIPACIREWVKCQGGAEAAAARM